MEGQAILLLCILVPLLGAFLLPLLGRISVGLRNITALILVLLPFVLSVAATPAAMGDSPIQLHFDLPLGLSFGFYADGLAVFMALVASLVAAIIVFYSFGYMEEYDNQNEYYMMVVLFIGAMMGLIYSTNLIFIYTFWELTAICCWRLIAFYRTPEVMPRASKAFLITGGGALVMLIGFVAIYIQTGTFDLLALQGRGLDNWIMILILFGILSKSATLPFHCWLPDAGVAPSPVTALLHAAVLVKIGVYVYARLFVVNFQLEPVWTTNLPAVCAVSALISAGAALRTNDLKRIIAYSTISQLAYILLGLSSGSMIGVAGGLLYILMHSLAKGGLFLCAGIIEHSTHTKDIRNLSGLYKRLPITTISFALCAFSVMGLPPFGGFFSKYMVISGAVETGNLWIAACFVIGAIMTVIYLLRLFIKLFFGELSHPDIREGTWEMVSSVAILGLLSLLFGIAIKVPADFVTTIVEALGRW